MRAAMKLATGVVPVALGVAMALMSGMAKAEDNAAQSQSLTGAVSAKTTLPSVGHRPYKTYVSDSSWYLGALEQRYDSSLLLPVGSELKYNSTGGTLPDRDNNFGANESVVTVWGSCKIYRVAPDATEVLIRDSGKDECERDYQVTESDIGHKIKYEIYAVTDPATYAGYTATPTESLPHIFMTGQVVSGLYDVRKTTTSPKSQTISFSDPDGVKVTINAADYNGLPVTGLNVSLTGKRNNNSPADAKMIFTPAIDNGDGSYSLNVKSSHPGVQYDVRVFLNGTLAVDIQQRMLLKFT